MCILHLNCRSRWPRGLRRRFARLLRLWVRNPPGSRMFVCCECCVLSADHSSRGVLPNVMRRCVWFINLRNEEALAHWGLLRSSSSSSEPQFISSLSLHRANRTITLQTFNREVLSSNASRNTDYSPRFLFHFLTSKGRLNYITTASFKFTVHNDPFNAMRYN